ncbi:MAG: ATP-binding cassette domain-containing protein [Polaribacter sp.]|jgi:putative ABC transport system ATP-binding protein|nr:ATP-binding cassette domain-containing protein [Polaribacter sp.]MDG1321128.1 ATP-binding cassette domain-containing protein [Polaribacter sp.]
MSDSEISESDIYLQESVLFEKGRKYLIRANSGHGKSSLLNIIYGSNANFDGNINYDGSSNHNTFSFRESKISYVFQDLKLFPDLTIFENIQLKNGLTNNKSVEEIDHLIDQVLLSHKRDNLVRNLSLGQKQRVAIIRALCQPFEFLLMDEPFSHLDEKNCGIISNIVSQELEKQNASLIMTSLGDTSYFDYDKILNL